MRVKAIGVAAITALFVGVATAMAAPASTSTSTSTTSVVPTTAPPGAPEIPGASLPPDTAGSVPEDTATPTGSSTPGDSTTSTIPSPGAGAPVVTLVPLNDEEALVVQRLVEGRTLAVESEIDPDAAGLDPRLDALFARSGQQRGTLEANRDYLREHGLRVRVDPETPWFMTVESIVFLEEPYERADVQVCFVDSNILYEPGGAPDGSDAIVNDDVGVVRILYTLVIEDGTWQLFHGQGLTDFQVGATSCSAV